MKVAIGGEVHLSCPDLSGIIVLTDQLNIIMCNQNAAQIFGVSVGELVGRNLRHLPLFAGRKDFFPEKGDSSYEIEKDGRIIRLDLSTLKNKSSKSLYRLAVVQDQTEYRRLQEMVHEQERLAVLGRTAAGVVHEIRNPMTAIKGFAQLLREKKSEHAEPYVSYMLEEIDNCTRIIGDFLKLARPHPVSLQRQLLNETVREVAAVVEPRAFLQNVKVEAALAPSLPECFFDAAQLKQVLLNLVDNALEAMGDGGVLRFKTFQPDPGQVGVAVEDTGCGIPENFLQELGKPFFSTREKGTGLGLFICQSIVQTHGGKLEVESREEKGTTFCIYLPLEKRAG